MDKKFKKIIWISSYPKSGNTWVRAIVSSLLNTSDGVFKFELLKLIPVFEDIKRYSFLKKSDPITYNRLNNHIKYVSEYWNESQKLLISDKNLTKNLNTFKTHSANLKVGKNTFTNSDFTLGNIYIVRDPREIVISYSKYTGKTIDQTIDLLSSKGAILLPEKNLTLTLMSSWDVHYKSWQMLEVPTLLIKYEDLLNNTKNEIIKIAKFLSIILELNQNKFNSIIYKVNNSTHIDKFRKYEKNFGFNEASIYSNFFGKAETASWKRMLSTKKILRIENAFKATMIELNYL